MISQAPGQCGGQPGLELFHGTAEHRAAPGSPPRGALRERSQPRDEREKHRDEYAAREAEEPAERAVEAAQPGRLERFRQRDGDERHEGQRDHEDRDERHDRAQVRVRDPAGQRVGKRVGEHVRGDEGKRPSGELDHFAHQAAPRAPRGREDNRADHGVIERGHFVATVPGCSPRSFSFAAACSAASRLGNGPARTRVRLPCAGSVKYGIPAAASLPVTPSKLTYAPTGTTYSSFAAAFFSAAAGGFWAGGFGLNGVSSSPGMRTLTGGASGRGSGSNTIGRKITASSTRATAP